MENSNYQINSSSEFILGRSISKKVSFRILAIACIVALPYNIVFNTRPSSAQAIAQSPNLSKNIIYVDPQQGDDSQVGKKLSPLKTITQALKIADAGTTIKLASGTYSEETGETFPLIIQDGISLKGDPRGQGYRTIIQGSGYFVSPTGAGQNVAIAAVKDAGGITGIRVSNNHSRGHGLWIESASPEIVGNSFTGNGNTGVSVNGDSSPSIENNYFFNNSGNGLVIHGTSQPQVVDNTFERTGFGVSILQDAAASLSGNIFDGNRIGIILEGSAEGVLRGNEIINSNESGLTAIAESRVDLGTDDEPGNNIFRSNNKLDIQNATAEEIPAVGTEVRGDTLGDINFDRGTFVATRDNSLEDLPPLPSQPLEPRTLPKLEPPAPATTKLAPLPPVNPIEEEATSSLPSPPPVTESDTGNKELIFRPSGATAEVSADVEPVPFLPQINNSALNSGSSQISSLSDVLGSRASQVKYKVLVEAVGENEEDEVRSLYPEAFKTVFQGESWLQVGAFSNWTKAKQAERTLVNLGLETYLIE